MAKKAAKAAGAVPAKAAAGAKKVLMLVGGPWHANERAGAVLENVLKAWGGRWQLTITFDLDALASLPTSDYAAVIVYTTGFRDDLTAPREKGLLTFVKNGGGLIGVHSAADSFRASRAYVEMLNAEFLTHPHFHEFPVTIVDKWHYLTARVPDFTIPDEMYHLQSYDPSKSHLLAETFWQGKKMPMATCRAFGKGRVVYIALGHDLRSWNHPEFQKLLCRALDWSQGAELPTRTVQCGVLGYGPAFNMGKGHGEWMNATAGLKTVAACDIDRRPHGSGEEGVARHSHVHVARRDAEDEGPGPRRQHPAAQPPRRGDHRVPAGRQGRRQPRNRSASPPTRPPR